MLSTIYSLGLLGVEPFAVTAEINVTRSIPLFEIVGLPDTAVRESRERVRSVFQSRGYPYPDGRIVVNLAPADVKKAGTLYDLPIFIGLLCASGCLKADLAGAVFLGELSLSGEVRRVPGVLPMLLGAQKLGYQRAFIPSANAAEAAAVQGMEIYAVREVDSLVSHLRGEAQLTGASALLFEDIPELEQPDFSEVKGQPLAKRALEIAAAGSHNVLLIGSPGAGKSMLAKRLPSILPEMTPKESIETTQIYSACGMLPAGVPMIKTRPFRAPHHSISEAGMCGGGSIPRPGEISLAHNGVLFLDELPEFGRSVMESLRQPLEDGKLTISRAQVRLTYPSRVTLCAAMNPCPCGYYGHPSGRCTCSESKVTSYLGKVSGPLLDRLDLHVEVMPVEYDDLTSSRAEETSASIKKRVMAAREIQTKRYYNTPLSCNAQIPPAMLSEVCVMTRAAQDALRSVFEKLQLSGRAYDRILKVARTIADLEASDQIELPHIAEAVQYRSLDRKYWGR